MEENGGASTVCCPSGCFSPEFVLFDQQLYHGFTSNNLDVRVKTFNNLKSKISAWLKGVDSPQHVSHSHNTNGVNGKEDLITAGSVSLHSVLGHHFSRLFYLSEQCPLEDVRQLCSQLLALFGSFEQQVEGGGMDSVTCDYIKTAKMKGASSFIPLNIIVPVNSKAKETKALFTEAYRQNNRLDYLTQIMGFHPQYLACFLRTQNRLIRADGPIPYTHRHYIAIIAAARHQCTYLIHLHTAEYLHAGGDRKWLESLDNVPVKLRNLQEINRLLAHRPWMVTSKTIEDLCRCGSNSWTMSELTHAIVLLAHFHSLSSAVFGCGVNFELDDTAGRLLHSDGESNSESDTESTPCEKAAVDILLDRLKELKDEADDYSEEEGKRRFETIESQTSEYPVQLHNGKVRSGGAGGSSPRSGSSSPSSCIRSSSGSSSSMSHLVDSPEFVYADFIRFKDTTQTFRASDYSWESHGFSIANRFYPDIGELLDEKFTVAKQFTYNTMGEKYTDINTQDFRTGIWNYIHCIMGIRHDDYDYSRVNSLLDRGLKSFIKLMTCYPERVSRKDFDSIMVGFTYSEKIHVNIILLEAKMQAELMYALRAVAQFMT